LAASHNQRWLMAVNHARPESPNAVRSQMSLSFSVSTSTKNRRKWSTMERTSDACAFAVNTPVSTSVIDAACWRRISLTAYRRCSSKCLRPVRVRS
jgi:hypothetical protein